MSDLMTRPSDPALAVTRAARSSRISGIAGLVVLGALVAMPFIAYQDTTDLLMLFFVYLVMASMWNLLAGFGGLVSIGQQAFVGLGAYSALVFGQLGINAYLSVVLAAITCAIIAVPTSLLAFRLRGDYFAVGTWVIAEVYRLILIRFEVLGGPSGASFNFFQGMDATLRGAITYWIALAVAAVTVFGTYLLLRGRIGLALTAIRDNEVAAASSGVRVARTKRIIYFISAAGCGAAGGVLLIAQVGLQPDAVFSVQWSAYMIFIVIIGGIGYLEGPIVGAIVFFVLQQLLASYGTWYLVVLGLIAMAGALWLPRGLWGTFSHLTGFRLFPVGYHLGEPTRLE